MAGKPSKHGTNWTAGDIKQLRQLAKNDKPTTSIAKSLQRTVRSVEAKAHEKKISLRTPN